MTKFCFAFSLSLFLLVSCTTNDSKRFYSEKVSPESITIERFDNALLQIDTTNMQRAIADLYARYPSFMPVFVEEVLGIPTSDTTFLAELIPAFLTDTLFTKVNQKEQETFANVSPIEKEIGWAFARLKTFYPNIQTPTIYFFVSGFNNSFLMNNTEIAIGADMYLGNDYPYYEQVVYHYMRYTMRPECIPVDIVSAFLFRNLAFEMNKNRLLENMIYRGRMMYFLSVLFPHLPKSEIMGYSPEQWEWCMGYEPEIWSRLLDNKDLFKTESMVITKYLNDAPFTSPISDASPGRLGTWIGWRIVQSYMNNNKHLTIQELMAEDDAQKILELSKYKP